MPATWALATAVAALPGALAWAWGRALVRAAHDPALPERVLAWRHRTAVAVSVAAAVLVVLLPHEAPWSLPLLVVLRLAGGFPARRALLGESWDLVAYLAWLARMTVGVGGFWLLLMLAPLLVSRSGSLAWPVAASLAVALVAWGLGYPRVLLWVTGGAPLSRPGLEARCRAIADRSTAPMPHLWCVGHPGGRTANAFALPSTRTPSVVFTRTVLDLFDEDELAAVFAHEQAHLEHYDARRVARLAVAQTAAVLVGTIGAAAALGRFESARWTIAIGWPLVVLVAALARLVRHKAHETKSDLRAVELCGNGSALARALVKLHALALLPRRLATEDEHRATHPSLANRLRAIEDASGRPDPPADGAPGESPSRAPTSLAGSTPGGWVVLEAERGHWLEGVPEGTPRESEALRAAASRVRTYAWSELVELRLKPRGAGHELVASDRSGAAWTFLLAAGEGSSAHAALDALDRKLAPASAARSERRLLAALVACAGALAALALGSAALLPALVAVVLPHPGPLAAFGVSALAATGVALLSGSATRSLLVPGVGPVAVLGLAVLGAAALWIVRTTAWRETAGRTRSAPWVALALALGSLVWLAPTAIGFATGGALGGHVASRDHPGGAVLLLGSAAALLVGRRRGARTTAGTLVLLATLPLALGSPPFARHFVHDPFFPARESTGVTGVATLEPVDERTVAASSGSLEMSPSGRSWAVHRTEPGIVDVATLRRIIVGSADGREHSYDASTILLLDDDRLLALFEEGEVPALELRPHDSSRPALWRVELPPMLAGAHLGLRRPEGRWRVSGTDPDSGDFVRATGDLDGSFAVERWSPGAHAAAWVAADGPAVLGIAPRFDAGDELQGSRVVALDAGGARELYASQLFVQCDAAPPGRTRPLCRTHDGSRSALWSLDPASGERETLAVLDGYSWPAVPWGADWLVLLSAGRRQDLYRVGEGRLTRLDVGDGRPWVQAVAGYDGGVGILVHEATGRSRLLRYALP